MERWKIMLTPNGDALTCYTPRLFTPRGHQAPQKRKRYYQRRAGRYLVVGDGVLARASGEDEGMRPSLRAAFAHAVASLSSDQVTLFEQATGQPLRLLVDSVLSLPHNSLVRVMDLHGGELGNT
jgi:hypothetical protein